MKKVIGIMLTAAMILSLAACGSSSPAPATTAAPAATEAATTAGPAATTAAPAETEAAATEAAPETIKIGVLLPYSGGSAKNGELESLGIELYTELFNKNGGVKSMGGAQIELVKADSTSVAEVGATEFQKLVEVEKVAAVLGPINSPVAAVTMPLADRYKIPYLIVNSGSDTLTQEKYQYSFRANVADCKALGMYQDFFNYLKDEKGYEVKKLICVHSNDDWGTGTANVMETVCKEMGIQCDRESFSPGTTDFSTIVNKIKAGGYDIVYMSPNGVNEAALFATTMNEYDCHTPTIGGGGGWIIAEFNEMSHGLGNESFCFVTAFSKDVLDIKPKANEVADIIYERTGNTVQDNTANGFMDAGILYEAIEQAGSTDADAIVKALEDMDMPSDHMALALHPYDSVSFGDYDPGFGYPMMYHENQTSTPSITQILDGEYRLVWPIPEGFESPIVWPSNPFSD